MAWWEILILLFLAGGAAALSKCLYSGGITHCTGCGQCEEHCPQNLEIRALLTEAHAFLMDEG